MSKRQLWLARLQEKVASGQTVRTWCSHNDVTEASYYYWRKRLATGQATATQLIALPFRGGYGEPVLEVEKRQTATSSGCGAKPNWAGSLLS